jgi:predicted RNA binding protein YcfA (HicA-like mRNA interferase family)
MPHYGPVRREVVITVLRKVGFVGPKSGGKHEYMIRGNHSVTIPNPHGHDVSREFLGRILKQAGISRDEWEKL